MVYYSQVSEEQLSNIFIGLTKWKKHPLEYDHAASYVDHIVDYCEILDQTSYHALARYAGHKKFGKHIFKYTRNKSTSWYIIYDVEIESNTIYIQHISSNHTTKSKNVFFS
jgi:hypothetical protein